MNLMSNIFFMVCLTSITGLCVQIIWMIASKLFVRGNPMFVYAGLRVVCISYLFPAAYIAAWLHFRSSFYTVEGKNQSTAKLLELTLSAKEIFRIAAVVWFCLLIIFVCYRLLHFLKWKDFIHDCREEDNRYILEKVDKYRKQLHLKNEILVCRSADVNSPMCTGLFFKRIILPEKEYTEKEIEIIFMHEIMHLQNYDLEIKWLSVIITMMHCFNPMAYFLYSQISKWSEVRCDILVCEKGKSMFSVKEYFDIIMRLACEKTGRYFSHISSSLLENSSDIRDRVICVTRYHNAGKIKKYLASAGMVIFLAAGLAVSSFGGMNIVRHYDDYIYTSFIRLQEGTEAWKEEKISDVVGKIWNCSVTMDFTFDPEKELYRYKGKIKPETLYKMDNIYKEAGTSIMINLILPDERPGNCVTIGILEPDGASRIVTCLDSLTYTFDIEENGYYSLFVINNNFSDIEVYFTYFL